MALVVRIQEPDGAAPRHLVFHLGFTVGQDLSPKGKLSPAGVLLADAYVSNLHARFTVVDGQWYVEDLGSTNGTYIGEGWQRRYGPMLLGKGDRVRIGHSVLTVVPT